ncbi:MAG: caspase family protein [Pleurocapsa sp. MO_226.B13]|nr:caspase family protein [Pleurocapsa sp. MO_226.B13]
MFKHNFNRNFAIIIGINNYQNGIRKLETAVPDARKLAEIIKKQHHYLKDKYQKQNKYEVQLLLDEQANLDELKQLIEDFKQKQIPLDNEKVTVTKDDRLLFYFAGHGIALDALENQEGPVGYLIPQDATSGYSSTYLAMQDLHDALNALPCRHMLAILDCCFAGAFRWSSLKREILPKVKVYKERYDRFISDAAWQVITSAADDQKALDSLGRRGIVTEGNEVHSPFAKALFDALRGEANEGADLNKDGIITATELYLYLRDKVEILTENNYKRQTPSLCPLRKHKKGEFIFLLPDFDRDKLDDAPPLKVENNPYKGLQSYDETDSKLFFGREESIKELREQVVSNKQAFTIVLGASGIGKSSLVKAGLIPNLRNSQEHQFKILDPMRPGESPLNSLAQVCLPITDEDAAQTMSYIKQLSEDLKKKKHDLENLIRKYNNPNSELLQVVEQLTLRDDLLDIEHLKFTDELQQSLQDIFSRNNDTEKQLVNQWINNFKKRKQLHEQLKKPIEDLSKALKQDTHLITIIKSWSNSHSNTKLLLPVDQFEELITLCKSNEEREQFQKSILNAIAKYPDKIHVVITLRLDFEAQFQNSVLQDFWNDNTRFVVPPMTQDELREVIEKPALEKVVFFEPPSLVDELINEVVQMPGALPLLSFTLSELYLKYSGDRTRDNRALTKDDYEDLGRVVGSITKRANQEYEKLVGEDPAYKDTVRRVMLRMISLQGGELARRQVPKSELEYTDDRENDRVQTVIKRFSEARLIVEGSNFHSQPYVEPAHDALVLGWDKLLSWKQDQKEQENLILQRQLTAVAQDWKNQQPEKFNWNATPYDWFQQLGQRNQHLGLLWNANPRLDLLKKVLNSQTDKWFNKVEVEFVRCSVRKRRSNTIVRWSIASAVIMGSVIFSAVIWLQLQRTELREKATRSQTLLSTNPIDGLVLEIQATGQNLSLLRLPWEKMLNPVQSSLYDAVEVAREQNLLKGHEDQVYSVAISPDGQTIASGGKDRTVRLWDKRGNPIGQPFREHEDSVNSVAFSPDGEIIASASSDGKVRLWDTRGNTISVFRGHEGSVNSVVFSPDGKFIVSGSRDKTVRLWDIQGNPIGNPFRWHENWVTSVAFSPNGEIIASASDDGTVRLWDIQGNPIGNPFRGHDGWVTEVTFSPNGEIIASGGQDGTVRLWDIQGNTIGNPFRGHDGVVYSVQPRGNSPAV